MSTQLPAIQVRNVAKHYQIFEQHSDRLRQLVMPRLQRLLGQPTCTYYKEFAALSDISFSINRGETVGIVGRNGSGKSTLLQIVCGILRPSSGEVMVRGRIAALLELGTGFNPEFTGRENVFLNAAIHGLSQSETQAKFDQIERFADIGAFIDQPVRTYSSGMYIRLGLSIAVNVDPDILIIDEALSVGDEAFQRKCFARIEEIQRGGGTILFVSHQARSVIQLCSRAILLDRGEAILEGSPKIVIGQYQRLSNLDRANAAPVRQAIIEMDGWTEIDDSDSAGNRLTPGLDGSELASDAPAAAATQYDRSLSSASAVSYESQGAQIRDPKITNLAGNIVNVLHPGQAYCFEFDVDFTVAAERVGFGMLIKTVEGQEIAGATTAKEPERLLDRIGAGQVCTARFPFICRLTPDTYFLNAGVTGQIADAEGNPRVGIYLHRLLDACMFRVMPAAGGVATGLVDLGINPEIQVRAGTDLRKVS